MDYMNLKELQAAAGRLPEQISGLKNMLEGLEQAHRVIREMSFTEETFRLLEQSRQELEEEIRILSQMQECLEQAANLYRQTDQKIADVYDMERVQYPRTSFGVSRITGLEGYKNLISFYQKGGEEK